ncbi:hypothetical protein LA76x_4970 [Lysobacter antibioticus]|uniref:Uncharacterized protein n=1 Tax=Lysobacter antibioticus TaxID=84531 RepID=A0A0S2FHS7_LYSAN|nr:hypothetical protein LA76x_4970 [Lysobacter antibioticus]
MGDIQTPIDAFVGRFIHNSHNRIGSLSGEWSRQESDKQGRGQSIHSFHEIRPVFHWGVAAFADWKPHLIMNFSP